MVSIEKYNDLLNDKWIKELNWVQKFFKKVLSRYENDKSKYYLEDELVKFRNAFNAIEIEIKKGNVDDNFLHRSAEIPYNLANIILQRNDFHPHLIEIYKLISISSEFGGTEAYCYLSTINIDDEIARLVLPYFEASPNVQDYHKFRIYFNKYTEGFNDVSKYENIKMFVDLCKSEEFLFKLALKDLDESTICNYPVFEKYPEDGFRILLLLCKLNYAQANSYIYEQKNPYIQYLIGRYSQNHSNIFFDEEPQIIEKYLDSSTRYINKTWADYYVKSKEVLNQLDIYKSSFFIDCPIWFNLNDVSPEEIIQVKRDFILLKGYCRKKEVQETKIPKILKNLFNDPFNDHKLDNINDLREAQNYIRKNYPQLEIVVYQKGNYYNCKRHYSRCVEISGNYFWLHPANFDNNRKQYSSEEYIHLEGCTNVDQAGILLPVKYGDDEMIYINYLINPYYQLPESKMLWVSKE